MFEIFQFSIYISALVWKITLLVDLTNVLINANKLV